MDYLTIRSYARENRQNATPAENKFWLLARGRELVGFKFNRQYVIAYKLFSDFTKYFIADFYCHRLKLIIELDGRMHEYQKEYDENRDEILKGLGLKVIRFSNKTVLNDWHYIVETINSFAAK